jgi:hypothetical protein
MSGKMECLFDGCDNFMRFVNNRDWLIESSDKRLAVQKALQWANFVETMHTKLEADGNVEEFARRYGGWRKSMALAPLQFAGFKSACDELVKSILLKHIDHQDIIKVALDEYLNQCGEERTLGFLRVFSAESLLLKLFAIFLCNEDHYEGGAPTLSRLSKAIWYEMVLKLLPEEVAKKETDWDSTVDKLIVSKTGVETLIFLTIMSDPHLEVVQKIIISRFKHNLVGEDGDTKRFQFWHNFIGCDPVLLCIMFASHEEFFEEFVEFFIRAGGDLKKTINENGDEEWAPSIWLKYEDVVNVAKMLITCNQESVSSYVTQVLLSAKDEYSLWEEITAELGNLMILNDS